MCLCVYACVYMSVWVCVTHTDIQIVKMEKGLLYSSTTVSLLEIKGEQKSSARQSLLYWNGLLDGVGS